MPLTDEASGLYLGALGISGRSGGAGRDAALDAAGPHLVVIAAVATLTPAASMAVCAGGEVGDALLPVLLLGVARIVFVAAIAGVLAVGGGGAGAALAARPPAGPRGGRRAVPGGG